MRIVTYPGLPHVRVEFEPSKVVLNILAPGVGFEPTRPRKATGFLCLGLKACALSTQPTGCKTHVSYIIPARLRSRRLLRQMLLGLLLHKIFVLGNCLFGLLNESLSSLEIWLILRLFEAIEHSPIF